MNINTTIFEGNLTAQPQLEHTTNNQTPVTQAVVLINRGHRGDDQTWIDDEPTRHRIKAWRTHAEHLAELP